MPGPEGRSKQKAPSRISGRTDVDERGLSSSACDVLGLGAFFTVHDLKVNEFAFHQRFVAGALDRGMMDENVLAGFLGNEAKTSLVVEPLNFSTGHNLFLPWLSTGRQGLAGEVALPRTLSRILSCPPVS